ncbi:MAG: LysR family transcriptional regulator [Parashewanella sp.]
MINPVWLHTFRNLVEIGHYTKTAEKLNMTQPGVSQHLKKLEQACGHTLIRRSQKPIELTEAGRRVYLYAQQCQHHEQQFISSLDFDDPYAGDCKIACSGSVALSIYPKLLSLQKQHKKIIIKLEVAPHNKIIDDIASGVIDVGIVTNKPTQSFLHATQLATEQLCLVYPAQFKNQAITATTLEEMGLIYHPDVEHYLSLYLKHCDEADLKTVSLNSLPIKGYINQLSQILLPVSQGLGFTILPMSAIAHFEPQANIKIFHPQNLVTESLYLVKRSSAQLPARYDEITKRLMEST